jgi:hypothetical protein
MIDVSDRPDVHVRLAAVKFLFRHDLLFLIIEDAGRKSEWMHTSTSGDAPGISRKG